MITGKLIAVGKTFQQDMKDIAKVDGKYVDMGWFQSQGQHPTAGMTYPELAKYHATGQNGVTPRDVLALTNAVYPAGKDAEILKVLGAWLTGSGDYNLEGLLDSLGKVQVKRIVSLFGDARLHAHDGNPDPLVDTGELRDHTARKTSTAKVVKKGVL